MREYRGVMHIHKRHSLLSGGSEAARMVSEMYPSCKSDLKSNPVLSTLYLHVQLN